jgi:hypothetical protein
MHEKVFFQQLHGTLKANPHPIASFFAVDFIEEPFAVEFL